MQPNDLNLDELLSEVAAPVDPEQRCGLIAIIGRPNVGKSTLINALVGQKISITSRKAQTTRHRIMGVRTEDKTQLIFVDTPGFQKKYTAALNKSLNKAVIGALADVDLVLFVVEAGKITAADRTVISLLSKKTNTILVANKLDLIERRISIAPWLQQVSMEHDFAEIVPMTAKKPKDIERLLELCKKYLPQQAWWYADGELTDKSERFLAAELIREKLFRLTGEELPYTSTVVIDSFKEEPSPKHKRMVRIAATIVVEKASHKTMVIGSKGERLKRIGTEARQDLEQSLDAKVFLETWVKVRSGWADDDAKLRSYGYE